MLNAPATFGADFVPDTCREVGASPVSPVTDVAAVARGRARSSADSVRASGELLCNHGL